MSTETTNKKIKIDNGTTFGRTYTDKAIDAKLPTDLIATANKLSLGVGNAPLGNGVNLDGFTYDEGTKTLKVSGGESIPVVEGTGSTTKTDGAYATYTIPEAQTSCFIFKCDLGTAFISYNNVFGTYNGYLDAEGSVTDGSLKLNSLIVLSGSGTTINIFFGNIGGDGGGGIAAPKSITSTADYAELTDTDYFISVRITDNRNVKNGTYILSGNKANGYSYWYPEDKSEGLNLQTYWHYIHYDSTGLTAIIFNSFLDATDNNKVGFGFNSKFPNNNIFGGFSVRQVPLFSKYTLVTNTTDEITPILPCTASDNGKVLSVVNGEAQWASASGGALTGEALMNATKDSDSITRTLDVDGKVKFDAKSGGNERVLIQNSGTIEPRTWEANVPVEISMTLDYRTPGYGDKVNYIEPVRFSIIQTWNDIKFLILTSFISKRNSNTYIYSVIMIPQSSGSTDRITDVFANVYATLY